MSQHQRTNMINNIKSVIFLTLVLGAGATWATAPVAMHLASPNSVQGSFGADITIDNEVQISGLQDLNFFNFEPTSQFDPYTTDIPNVCIYSNTLGNFYTITLTGENAYTGNNSDYSYQLNNNNPGNPKAGNNQIWYNVHIVTEGQTYNLVNKTASPRLRGATTPNCGALGDPLVQLNFDFLSSTGAYAMTYGAYMDTLSILIKAA
jgi:hypothetical protein